MCTTSQYNNNKMATEDNNTIITEVCDNKVGDKIGICKWFNNVYGYGFLTVWSGEEKGTDVFVHHSGIKPSNSQYKTLKKGEYLSFDIVQGPQGSQAVNVRGVNGGPLLCDHVQVRRTNTPNPGWTTVAYKNKRRPRGGDPAQSDGGAASSVGEPQGGSVTDA
jgi:cold shock CspA family protein